MCLAPAIPAGVAASAAGVPIASALSTSAAAGSGLSSLFGGGGVLQSLLPSTPAQWVGLGLKALGSLTNASANNDVIDARNDVQEDELRRQRLYQQRANKVLDDQVGNFDRQNQDNLLAQVFQTRDAALQEAIDTEQDYVPQVGSAPKVVNTDIARRLNNSIKEAKGNATKLANLGSFDDLNFDNRIKVTEGARDINQINDFSRGSNSLVPYELNAANRAGDGKRAIGDLFTGAGSIATLAGAGGIKDVSGKVVRDFQNPNLGINLP